MEASTIDYLNDTQKIKEHVKTFIDQILRSEKLQSENSTRLLHLYTSQSACEDILKNVIYMCSATLFLAFMMMLFGIVRNKQRYRERRFRCCGCKEDTYDEENEEEAYEEEEMEEP